MHLRTLIATSLSTVITRGATALALQPRQVTASRLGLLARTPHCGAESRQENAPTCWREGRGERAQSENLLEAGAHTPGAPRK
ncbi:uncharacterized protein LOC118572248 isoform X3 [Onychomys torridus]|uniref:uncharacterized protein LOC118572248 isoform X3 n=1 Tax=Onychomys torridus TaxID=38674 RepID=UPI00167F64A3|nr:uncharacterized protein LOC118572248 isoform X3 [Onychomys torridus]